MSIVLVPSLAVGPSHVCAMAVIGYLAWPCSAPQNSRHGHPTVGPEAARLMSREQSVMEFMKCYVTVRNP